MAQSDPTAGLVAFLLAQTDVTDLLAGSYVFGDELPQKPSSIRAAIVAGETVKKHVIVKDAGLGVGPGNRSRMRWTNPRVDVFAYGETPYEAKRLDLACYEALKQMVSGVYATCLLHDAQLVSGPISLREQDTQWPFRFRSYIVAAAEEAVGV